MHRRPGVSPPETCDPFCASGGRLSHMGVSGSGRQGAVAGDGCCSQWSWRLACLSCNDAALEKDSQGTIYRQEEIMNRDQMNAAFGVTDEQLDSLAADYEAGDWKGRLGPVVQGRPRLYEEEMRTISFRIPASRLQAIDAHAERNGKSRSEFLRQAIDDALLTG